MKLIPIEATRSGASPLAELHRSLLQQCGDKLS